MDIRSERTRPPWRLLAIFLLLSCVIALVGGIFHRYQAEAVRGEKEAQLVAVADLKVNEIVAWRKERLGDAEVISRDTLKGEACRRWLKDPSDRNLTEGIRGWLRSVADAYGYESVTLLDEEGRVMISVPEGLDEPPMTRGYLLQALQAKRPVFTDLHRAVGGERIHMDLVTPLRDVEDESAPPVASVRMEVDPASFLYPLIQRWPTPSATAETLVVRRDGEDVLFLNDLRHRPSSALSLRIPVSRASLPASAAVRGYSGAVEGIDYRDVPVLAVTRAVPGTDWFMVSKVDQEEIYAPIREDAYFTTALAAGLILAAAGFVFFIWSRQQGRTFRRLYELEAARREMAERYESLLRHANDSIILTDAEGQVVEVNDRAMHVYGYLREEFLRLDSSALRSDGRMPALGARMPESEKSNGLVYETVHLGKDGRRFPVEVSLRRVSLAGKDHYLCIVRDITERKRAEERIMRLNRLYAVLSNINQMVVRVRDVPQLFDEVCRIAVADGRFPLAWVGRASGRDCRCLVPAVHHSVQPMSFPEGLLACGTDPEVEHPSVLACRTARSIVSNDLEHSEHAGPWLQAALDLGFRSCASVPLFERGTTIGAFTVYSTEAHFFDIEEVHLLDETGIDISFALDVICQENDRLEAEKALKVSERKFRTVFDNAGDAIVIHDFAGCILEVNRAACESLGYSREALLEKSVFDLNPGDLRAKVVEQNERLRREGRTVYETPLVCRDGSRFPVEVSGRVIEYEGAPAMLKFLRDISERKRLEAQVSQSQKMEVIGRLAGGIAHEFNNILGIISGYVELSLTSEGDLDREIIENLLEVLKATERARDVVRQILVFSRRVELEKKPIRVSAIAGDALKLLRASIPSTIEIRADIVGDGVVLANPTQLHQLLMNLCTNARDAMRQKGGRLDIRLEEVRLGDEAPRLDPDLVPGAYLRLLVEDTGHGIDPSIIAHVFDPYFTTKPPGEGTGIGLALVRGIAKDLGGAVFVRSEPGEGAVFEVLIPRQVEAEIPENRGAASAVPRGNGERVLLADDEPLLRTAMQRILESLNYRVVLAEDGLSALEKFREGADTLDLLVSDVTMPGLTGVELVREVRRLRADFPVILCTGFSDLLTDEQAEDLGVRGVLMKPVIMRDLAEMLRRVLGDGGAAREA